VVHLLIVKVLGGHLLAIDCDVDAWVGHTHHVSSYVYLISKTKRVKHLSDIIHYVVAQILALSLNHLWHSAHLLIGLPVCLRIRPLVLIIIASGLLTLLVHVRLM
jgi:hypothetical protein